MLPSSSENSMNSSAEPQDFQEMLESELPPEPQITLTLSTLAKAWSVFGAIKRKVFSPTE